MPGSPVPKDKQLCFADGSFFEFPALRWSVAHMRELMPTVNVSRGLAAPSELPKQLVAAIDALTFMPLNSKQKITWEESL